MHPLVELIALCVYAPIIVWVHELGHALFARRGGYRVTSLGIGMGRPLWRTRLRGGVVLHVDRWLIAGGACVAVPDGVPSYRRAWFHGGGLIAQVALALALAALPPLWWVDRMAHFNELVFLTNLLPWRTRASASDGWYLWDLVRGGGGSASMLSQRAALEKLAAREAAVDSPLGKVYADVCLAWLDILTGRVAEAGYALGGDPPESAVVPWIDALFHYVRAEWHRKEGRALDAIAILRSTRAAVDAGVYDESLALLDLAEARALVQAERTAEALRVIARVSGLGGAIGRQASLVQLAAVLDGPPQELEYATWRVIRQSTDGLLDPADAAQILWRAGEQLIERQRRQAGEGTQRAAQLLAQATLKLAHPEDRATLAPTLAPALNGQGHTSTS